MKIQHALIAASLALAGLAAQAQVSPATAPSASASASASAGMVMTDGEVRKIDLDQGKVTLRHARIENLDMDGMTMVFKASDPALLRGLKVGQKVRFHAEEPGGVLSVTVITPAP